MFLKTFALACGLCGAAATSQYPEFAQQYVQRLGGEVDALTTVLADFDASAQASGLTREAALASMGGTAFLENRRRDMRNTITRHADLQSDLEVLRASSPVERLTLAHRVSDRQTAAATWRDFRPAVPLSLEGLIAGGVGFVLAYLGANAIFWFLAWPFRRRKSGSNLSF